MNDRFKFRVKINSENKVEIFNVVQIDFEYKQVYFKREDGILYNIGFAVEGIELIQCTGLKDKNCKLIYEGDIVKKKGNKFLSVITFNEEGVAFMYSDEQGIHFFYNRTAEKLEILGNIYENRELIRNSKCHNL